MADSLPRRHFLPEPVETSTRSSKRPHHEDPAHTSHVRFETTDVESQPPSDSKPSTTKPRRFLPQPIEESTKTSRKPKVAHIEDTSGQDEDETWKETGDAPQSKSSTVEKKGKDQGTAKPSPRRFAAEPVETTKSSSRKKFAPEPIESSTRSSKDKRQKAQPESSSTPARRKFLPEPVETSSTRQRRKKPAEDEDDQDPSSEEDTSSRSTPPSRTSSGEKKFAPELLETAKGSYRRSQVASGSSSPKDQKPSSSSSTANETADTVPELEESRFSAANLAKQQNEPQRRRSFRIPDLPIIESDESEGSDSEPPSLTETPSDSSVSTDIRQTSKPNGEDTYTDYVLGLAAKHAQQQQFQDQAMAAYINERPHEPVHHFAFDSDSEEETPKHVGKLSGEHGIDVRTFRRESAADLDWELQNMQRHHEQLEEMKRDFKENTCGQSRFSAAALISRQHHGVGAKGERLKAKKGLASDDDEEDVELKKMRTAASPPMLGGELVFPMTISPKMTRCDVDQVPRPRTAAKDDGDEMQLEGDPQLWSSNINVSNGNSAGLWMGLCQKTETQADNTRPPTPMRSGIQTPAHELRNPFETATPGRIVTPGGARTPGGTRRGGKSHLGGLTWLPLTPPRDKECNRVSDGSEDDPFTASIDKKLNLERQIEEEFPNRVITQIYNYLSLGYPILARPFDEELGKISRISVEELRKDDSATDAKGYVGAPEGDGVDDEFVEKGRCRRWEALRVYVREWARQSPAFKEEAGRMRQGGADWGTGARVRRGSWAH